MNIYKLTRKTKWEYEDYDSAIVAAETVDDAKTIHPDGEEAVTEQNPTYSSWVALKDVEAALIGIAVVGIERGVLCASFNAG